MDKLMRFMPLSQSVRMTVKGDVSRLTFQSVLNYRERPSSWHNHIDHLLKC